MTATPDCEAKYEGVCAWCTGKIEIGQPIKFWRKNVYHFDDCRKAAQADAEKPLTYEQRTRPGYL